MTSAAGTAAGGTAAAVSAGALTAIIGTAILSQLDSCWRRQGNCCSCRFYVAGVEATHEQTDGTLDFAGGLPVNDD